MRRLDRAEVLDVRAGRRLPYLIFVVLGPLFLLAGLWRCLGTDRNPAQGRTWLIVGVIFSAVALYLAWFQRGAP